MRVRAKMASGDGRWCVGTRAIHSRGGRTLTRREGGDGWTPQTRAGVKTREISKTKCNLQSLTTVQGGDCPVPEGVGLGAAAPPVCRDRRRAVADDPEAAPQEAVPAEARAPVDGPVVVRLGVEPVAVRASGSAQLDVEEARRRFSIRAAIRAARPVVEASWE